MGVSAAVRRRIWLLHRRRLLRRELRKQPDYASWCARHDTPGADDEAALRQRLSPEMARLQLHLVLGLQDAEPEALQSTLASLQSQWHGRWRLYLHGLTEATTAAQAWAHTGCSAEARVQLLAGADLPPDATWLLFCSAGEIWREHALLLLAEAALLKPGVQLVYADHDSLDTQGRRIDPHFKCDWNPELLLSHDYLGPPALWRAASLRKAGVGIADSAHRRALRATAGLDGEQVLHLPHVLVHRPPDAAPLSVDLQAVADSLGHAATAAQVLATPHGARVRFALPDPLPRVTVIVPTRNALGLLRTCIDSLLRRTDYPAMDLLIVDNGSDDPDCLRYLDMVARKPQVRVLRDESPFNFAALNNRAVAQCEGDFVLLLNNDIEIVDAGWLREMIGLAARRGVGAVGARLLYGNRCLQHAGVVLGLGGEAGHVFRHQPGQSGGYLGRAQRLMALSAVTAACLAVRRDIYLAVGGMDAERFAVAFNDVDFCLRLQARGLRNLYTPHAVLLHHESASRGEDMTPAQKQRLRAEQQALHQRWGPLLMRDPAYNPNLSLQSMQFALADPPRVTLRRPWYRADETG